jgi:hypothetical protein
VVRRRDATVYAGREEYVAGQDGAVELTFDRD